MIRLNPFRPAAPRVSVVRLQGPIGMGTRGLSDAALAPVIEKAFKGKPSAVALQLNSPGGSPVQSSLIASRIRRLADENKVPVLAFVEDVAASGGYWLAVAADEIFVDPASVVGSIGVISAGFGAHDFIERYGVERRVHTAGKSKSFMDPFRPEKPEDIARLTEILEDMHEVFIGHIQSRRAGKLTEDPDLFTGKIWIGQKAVDVGLVDGVGHPVPILKERYGDKVRFRRFGARRSLFQRLGADAAGGAVAEFEERLMNARYGL